MSLYTDDNPKTTLKGLGFKNKEKAEETIKKVEEYFENMKKRQKKNNWTPDNVLPKKYLKTNKEINDYYQLQKMYRILGMNNRAKGMLKNTKNNDNLKEAIKVFDKWMKKYKNI